MGLGQVFLVHAHRETEIQGYIEKEKNKKGKRGQLVPAGSPAFLQCPTKFCNLELYEALLNRTKQPPRLLLKLLGVDSCSLGGF